VRFYSRSRVSLLLRRSVAFDSGNKIQAGILATKKRGQGRFPNRVDLLIKCQSDRFQSQTEEGEVFRVVFAVQASVRHRRFKNVD
jgi:hypothetical protein